MTTLSVSALQLLARSAGWSGMDVYRAVAVALAESSGDPNATSSNPDGGTNVGLWQLDTKGVGAGYTVRQLQDPLTNASVAWRGWNADGNTFEKEWATAVNGTAAAHMVQASGGAATAADFSGQKGGSILGIQVLPQSWQSVANSTAKTAASVGVGSGITGQLGTIAQDLTTPAFWGRVGLVIIGAALVIAGLAQVAKPVTAPVVSTVKKGAALAAV